MRFAALILLLALPASAEVRMVTPETAGSVAQAVSGDEIILGPGIYLGPLQLRNDQGGSEGSPTILRAREPGTVRVVGVRGAGDGVQIGSECREPDGCHWVVVDGLELCWSKRDGIRIYGNHVVVRNCHIHRNGIRSVAPGEGTIRYPVGNGIGSWFHQDVLIEECVIEHNGSSEYDHGIYLLGKRWTIRRCRLQYNAGIGVHAAQPSSDLRIENNVIAANRTWGLHLEYEDGQPCGAILDNVLLFNGKQPLALMHGGANPPIVRGNWIYGNAEPVLGVGGTMTPFPVATQPAEDKQ